MILAGYTGRWYSWFRGVAAVWPPTTPSFHPIYYGWYCHILQAPWCGRRAVSVTDFARPCVTGFRSAVTTLSNFPPPRRIYSNDPFYLCLSFNLFLAFYSTPLPSPIFTSFAQNIPKYFPISFLALISIPSLYLCRIPGRCVSVFIELTAGGSLSSTDGHPK